MSEGTRSNSAPRLRFTKVAILRRTVAELGSARRFSLDDPRVEPCPMTGCWLWMGHVMKGGYGRVKMDGVTTLVHRLSWLRVNGSIPVGMVLDHLCRNRSCLNPDHLRLVTTRINSLENSVSPPAANAAKIVCGVCGGQYATHRSRRLCVPCERRRCRAYKKRQRLIRRRAKLRARVSEGGAK